MSKQKNENTVKTDPESWENLFQIWKNSVIGGPVGRLPTYHEISALILERDMLKKCAGINAEAAIRAQEERDQLKAEVERLRAKVKLAVWQRDVEMWNNPTLTGKRQELIRSYNDALDKE